MDSIELSPGQMFAAFPDPVLLVRDGLIRYCNPAADRLFPSLAPGEPIPPELAALLPLERPATALGPLGNRQYRVNIQATPEGDLIFLHAVPMDTHPIPLDAVTAQLRQQTAGLAAALQRLGPGTDESRRDQYLSLANQGLYRMLRLADHLDFMDRADTEVYHPTLLDLAGLCAQLARELEGAAVSAGYHFQYESDLTSLFTMGDTTLLRRLLLGLLSNAMGAAGPGVPFGLKLARQQERAVLTIWDNGLGLDENGLAALFGTRPDILLPAPGLGLGLPTARRVVELHGGAMIAEGGSGLRITISLPIRINAEGGSLCSPVADYTGGFSPLMMELSTVLPAECYAPEHLE